MNTRQWTQIGLAVLWLNPLSICAQEPAAASLDTAKIEQLTGIKGKLDPAEQVFKLSQPRADLAVTVAGVKMTPAMGFTSWAAFLSTGKQVMVMGDMVLLEDQIDAVMSAALEHGIEVTALHNHFLWETPRILFMHVAGRGDLDSMAAGIGKVFAAIKGTGNPKHRQGPRTEIDAAQTSLDPKAIETLLGVAPEKNGEVYKVTIGRTTRVDGHPAGKVMGVNTWAAFAGSDQNAVVDGDFAMRESELQGVLKALRRGGISITAIHHHMVNESPKIVFLHYWGTGSVSDLAKAIKTALATQSSS